MPGPVDTTTWADTCPACRCDLQSLAAGLAECRARGDERSAAWCLEQIDAILDRRHSPR